MYWVYVTGSDGVPASVSAIATSLVSVASASSPPATDDAESSTANELTLLKACTEPAVATVTPVTENAVTFVSACTDAAADAGTRLTTSP